MRNTFFVVASISRLPSMALMATSWASAAADLPLCCSKCSIGGVWRSLITHPDVSLPIHMPLLAYLDALMQELQEWIRHKCLGLSPISAIASTPKLWGFYSESAIWMLMPRCPNELPHVLNDAWKKQVSHTNIVCIIVHAKSCPKVGPIDMEVGQASHACTPCAPGTRTVYGQAYFEQA